MKKDISLSMYSPDNNLLHLEQTLLHLELLLHQTVYFFVGQVTTSRFVHRTHCVFVFCVLYVEYAYDVCGE